MFRKNHPLVKIINGVLVDLPTPVNISSHWNYGSLLGLVLAVQILTGIVLATRFSALSEFSFERVVNIFQDSGYGWLIRLIHSTGASFFFLFLYMHIGRGLYYGSYSKAEVWNIGVIIFFVLIGTAFLGYVLPWGQMSYWAATVITNLVSAIPYIGTIVVQWLWGGFAVGNYTLVRFFALHYLLPFVVLFFVVLHVFFLHAEGRRNPLGVSSSSYKVSFHYYHSVGDILGFIMFGFILILIALSYGYVLMDAENFIPANPLQTPTHIQPEWYFLFAYAILRSIPNKLGGVLALVASIALLILFPFFSKVKSGGVHYSPLSRFLYWSFVTNFLLLTWLGSAPAEPPFVGVSFAATVRYFFIAFCLIFANTKQSSYVS